MKKHFITGMAALISLSACNNNGNKFDASGTFEAEEVVVSSIQPGKILSLKVEEGMQLAKDSIVGLVDPENLILQQEQVQESIKALQAKTADVTPQVQLLHDQLKVQETQLNNLNHEKTRIENLLRADAATQKQLDDISFQIESLQKQMMVTRQQVAVQVNNVNTQNRSILSEAAPLGKRSDQLNDLIKKASVLNPVNGTVLTKYVQEGEIVSSGKALYKIADLSTLKLRAYVTGDQFAQLKLNQQVKVMIDDGKGGYKEYPGTITWISDKAEFTPKTIQTKEERANLVYAVKINVKNDGLLKIGMFGEVKLSQ
ncbi:MAG: HlyD family efflux transporter periplasmic adaptor subunit [Sphingobacteriales bacterium]|nr:HlyD family efflux transporter periplasmic adaptor subunit [Sphingobacteriales bacterium]